MGWWRDGGFSVVKIKPGSKMFVADFCFGWGKMGVKLVWLYTIPMIWTSNIFSRYFCSLRIFFTNKKLHDPHLLVLPWGEFGGHWPKGLVLIRSQMVSSNETWTALVDCLGKASCWQRALDHTLEGTFMAGTLWGVHVMGMGLGWVRVGKVDQLSMLWKMCLIGDWWGLCGVFFVESLWGM